MRTLIFLIPLLGPTLSAATTFDEVKPIFAAKCFACHNQRVSLGKLSLHTPEAVLKGGETGEVIVPGDAAKSLLIDKIVTRQMPPGKDKLTDSEIDQIRTWINTGLPKASALNDQVSAYEIRGILQARCVLCHGSDRKEGGLDLRTLASRLKGGKSGPAIVPGKPEASLLYTRIVKGEMPPAKEAKALAVELPTDAETEKIKTWIAAGAKDADPKEVSPDIVKESDKKFWSFQSPVKPALPTVKSKSSVRNNIDLFLLAKLEAKGLAYNKEADKRSLLRRVYLDLTGLPPTPAELAAYEADKSPTAYERAIDKLLASPRYGERWGQHWLDLAGYSDSEGFGQDDGVRRYAWRYRDYLIEAFNDNFYSADSGFHTVTDIG